MASPRRPGRLLPPPAPRAIAMTLVLAVAVLLLAWIGGPSGSVPGSPARDQVAALLASVAVVPGREKMPGYERDCSGASGCVFGPAWSDTTGAPGSWNGCDTRQDVLARDLHHAAPDPSAPCAVTGGVLIDPYTGRVVDIGEVGTRGVHVDHVFPLSAAWDLGAWSWSERRRAAFANDADHNLLAVTGAVNMRKGDATPGDWLPPDPARHCFYAARYLSAAVSYGLPVTAADREALEGAVRRCPS